VLRVLRVLQALQGQRAAQAGWVPLAQRGGLAAQVVLVRQGLLVGQVGSAGQAGQVSA